jgi:hypothetical protein
MSMEHFANEGFGWTCRRCSEATTAREPRAETHNSPAGPRARFFHEGEAGSRARRLHAPALARWRDDSRRTLVCPNCGVEESMEDD